MPTFVRIQIRLSAIKILPCLSYLRIRRVRFYGFGSLIQTHLHIQRVGIFQRIQILRPPLRHLLVRVRIYMINAVETIGEVLRVVEQAFVVRKMNGILNVFQRLNRLLRSLLLLRKDVQRGFGINAEESISTGGNVVQKMRNASYLTSTSTSASPNAYDRYV